MTDLIIICKLSFGASISVAEVGHEIYGRN